MCRIVGGGDGDKKKKLKLKQAIDSDRCVSVVCVLVDGLHVDEVAYVLAALDEVVCVLDEAVCVLCATPAPFRLFWQRCVSVILVSFSPVAAAVAVVLAWASVTRRPARRLRWDRAGEAPESHRPQRRP